MSREEENYVALFIDWDNLAISTAVDFAGAVPDVRAIVRTAQRSGTILIARAYAEWNVSSDRLSVYRAGIEPVYAPTFRFEPEPGSQVPRGKSLADPCLVTDCIDTMHLMPSINVFVLVSGDKDLIPIVRLAQLRGKRVVVIGPDFVAAILREMADEYIPYRTLVETAEAAPAAEVSLHGGRGHRRIGPGQARSSQLPATAPRQPAQPPAPRAVSPSTPAKPSAPSLNGSATIEATAPSTAEELEAEPAPVPAEEQLEVGPLYEVIAGILREREQTGKPRLRATNLKDQLLARIPGFNERKYGFSRFKDLLAAAEKAGVLIVSRTGPVQWVAPPAAAPAPVAEAEATPAATLPAAPTSSPPPAAEVTGEPEEIDAEVVRFLLELRERSRWLTYTYLLTNLLNHLGKGSADAAADAAARATLNRLVQAGVLVVDREPREIDVNGTRHRVRLCHIVDEHPLVASLRAQLAHETANAVPAAPAEEPRQSEPATPPEANAGAQPGEQSEPAPPVSPSVETAPGQASSATEGAGPETGVGAAPRESVPGAEVRPEASEVPTVPVEAPALPESLQTEPSEAAAESPEPRSSAAEAAPTMPPLTLAESYDLLREVVREATGPNRPSTGPAAVKNRLVRRLGAFDERAFGFGKFKDYLLAAERAGAVKVDLSGTSARVSLPTESSEG